MPAHTNIVWFRQDLRLHDHPALHAALQDSARIIPVYILDTSKNAWPPGGASKWWLHHSLAGLAKSLADAGASLILRQGDPATILPELAEATGAHAIHASRAHEPHWRRLDKILAASFEKAGRTFTVHPGATLIDPNTIRSQTNTVYGMYTPFARAVEASFAATGGGPAHPIPAPARIPGPATTIASARLEDLALLPTKPDWSAGLRDTWTPGETHACARLKSFASGAVSAYATGRNLPGQDGTSMLSPHLHWGELSPRDAWHATATASPDHQTYRRELIWRDFAAYLLWHHPTLPDKPLRPAFANLEFRRAPQDLRAWQRGHTGIPIVDAGLRQLWQTGWMHNRVRMITASFLVKHLLIDWRDGETWFWDTLVDADLASNAASWQWVAGTGIDAQPFFRVFNPVTQGEKFDADGAYVRRFVPELAALPNKLLHAPWTAPDRILAQAGVVLGKTYARPLIDLADGRNRALDVYRRTVRDSAPPREAAE
jgi:deoxyribodipyrimidine photo-lyase